MNSPILICTDLDRTLLPNGLQVESPGARNLFRKLVANDQVFVAYVSGRDKHLLQHAIREYDLPTPDFAIGDVGSTLYHIHDDDWQPDHDWENEIQHDWQNQQHADLAALLADMHEIKLQEPDKQNKHKLSYYAATTIDSQALIEKISQRLEAEQVHANLIWSIDETTDTGLLDILPASANKLHAINFLINKFHFSHPHCVFAGDSGNDLPVITSQLQSVLVANATANVKQQALTLARQQGNEAALYIAQGNFHGMNGNYAAGILEGVVHYLPYTAQFIFSD